MLARSFARIAHLNSQKITYYLALEGFSPPRALNYTDLPTPFIYFFAESIYLNSIFNTLTCR